MTYAVVVKPAVAKYLDKLPEKFRKQIVRDYAALREDPRPPSPKSKMLAGMKGVRRLRSGDCRSVYIIIEKARKVIVGDLAPRGQMKDSRLSRMARSLLEEKEQEGG